MANKRGLKKDINYLTYDLLAECFTYQYFHKDADPKKMETAASKILEIRNELVSRINHIDGKENPKLVKAYFQKIRKDYKNSIEALDILVK